MLFNTAWNKTPEVQLQPDLLSTASLVAWLEQQPAAAPYDYNDPGRCLLGKYFRQHGHRNAMLGNHYAHDLNGVGTVRLPSSFYDAATPKPHTFGAALQRAKAHL